MKIELSETQIKKFEDWKKTFKPLPYLGAVGGHFGISILFTGIGIMVEGYNWKDDKIDLTEL